MNSLLSGIVHCRHSLPAYFLCELMGMTGKYENLRKRAIAHFAHQFYRKDCVEQESVIK